MSKIKSNHSGLIIAFRVIFALMTLAVMAYIFMLSAENAKQSSQTSAGVIEKIVDTFVSSYKEMPVEEKKSLVSSLQDVVRKAAHFAVYAVLGFCASCFISTFNGRFWLKLIICQSFSSLYALSDEYHQTFSEGRSFQISDIAFDSVGAFCGIIFVLLVVLIFKKAKNKGGEKVKKRDLINNVKAFEAKLMEADAYIKELNDLIVYKDNEIKRLESKVASLETALAEPKECENLPVEDFCHKEQETALETEAVVKNEYHDFDFTENASSDPSDDVNTYAVKAIGKIVTESVKIGCVLASSDNENKKELLNLTLGRTEVAKNEISALVTTPLEPDLLKASIDKECALVMEYYQSILSQL